MRFSLSFSRILWARSALKRNFSSRQLVLGIESTCDDTGAAVVDDVGNVLGEGYKSQMKIHLENGGVIPHIAVHYHSENIEDVVATALNQTGIGIEDLSAIAVATKPGLRGSLRVGIDYAQTLARKFKKPLIPVHHMEAHALTARISNNIKFPFLCLLASGAHCQITLVKGINEFLLFGESQHNSPGETLDKIARRLKLSNLPECSEMSGGRAIDFMASDGNPLAYKFPQVLTQLRDCHFSFSGFSSHSTPLIEREELKYDVPADGVIPTVKDFCASLLYSLAVHMIHRIHRAFAYCEKENLIPVDSKTLVFSGGVACNTFIREALEGFCDELGVKLYVPPPKLCTDNGIMIAWNGMEKLKAGVDIFPYTAELKSDPDSSLGVDISEDIIRASIKIKTPKLKLHKKNDVLDLEVASE